MGNDRLRQGFALRPRSRRLVGGRLILSAAATVVTAQLGLGAQAPQTAPPPPATAAPKAKEAPKAEANLPSARSIVDRHVAAVGGKAAILAHSSSRATGTFTVASAGMTGAIEVFAAKPDKSMVKISIPGVGEVIEAYDGKNGWTLSAMTGPMLLEGKQLEEKKFDTDFFGELHEDRRYESMTTVERTEFDGRQCYKVRLVRKGGGEDFEFYDVETGLKAGRIATRETPMGTVTGTSTESDYKKFGNLLQPTTVKNTMMGVQQLITITSIEYDNVQSSVFDPPAQIKALIK
jgi:hypothetical protein